MRLQIAMVVLIVAMVAPWAADLTSADSPSDVVLEPVPVASPTPGQHSVVLAAKLLGQGQPVAGEPVTFYVVTTVFGERLMMIGSALSDATGTASLLYRPTWSGDYTVVARFAGGGELGASEVTFHFEANDIESPYHPAEFGIDPIRTWLPVFVGIVLLTVLFVLGFATFTTVAGIRAAAATAPVAQPLPPWDSRVQRPAPIGKAIALMLLLLIAGAYPAWQLLGQSGGREAEVILQPGQLDGGSTPLGEATLTTVGAELVSRIETAAFDRGGQPAPGSVTIPTDLAVTEGRVRLLDSSQGRIAAITESSKLATIFDGSQYSEATLKGAEAMAPYGDQLYVALPQGGHVLVLSAAGEIEGIIPSVLPPAENSFTAAGIAVTTTGEIWMSDSANHRVVMLNANGEFERVLGTGAASTEADAFNSPAGLTLDRDGNLYVADSHNGVVKKFSPTGVLLGELGRGWLGLPTSVVVDDRWQVYVTDESRHVVSVFAGDGQYIGSISETDLSDPHKLATDGDLLYVIDRLSGLFVFRISDIDAS
jgi:hypothetical protein